MKLDHFRLYHKYRRQITKLTEDEAGRLLFALMAYSETGEAPELSGREEIVFDFIAVEIEREQTAYDKLCEKRSQAGKQGGRPRKNRAVEAEATEEAFASSEKQEKAKKPNAFSEKQEEAKKPSAFLENQMEPQKANGFFGPPPFSPSSPPAPSSFPPDPPISNPTLPNPPIIPPSPCTTTSAGTREDGQGLGRVMDAYMDRIYPTPSPMSMELLAGYVKTLGEAVCLRAIDRAVDAGGGKRNWNYIHGTLRRLEAQGVKCLGDWETLDEKHRSTQRQAKGAGGPVEGPTVNPDDVERMIQAAQWAEKVRGKDG